jgi:putative chitinase
MITITAAIILALSDKERPELVAPLVAAMNEFFPQFEINTEKRVEHFLAQSCHEADGFRTLTEYASGKAYEGRADLGNAKRGDGAKYKGRGIFQITGRTNYAAAGKAMGIDAIAQPELLATPRYAVWSACLYWQSRKLNALADRDDLRAITKKINGGYNGLSDRQRYLERARKLIQDQGAATVTVEDPRIGPTSPPEIVKALQKLLADRSYQVGAIDGKWGRLTRDAVLALKADAGLDTGDPTILLSQAKAAPKRVIENPSGRDSGRSPRQRLKDCGRRRQGPDGVRCDTGRDRTGRPFPS